DDLELAFGIRVGHPVIEAAPLQRIMDLAGPVGRNDHDRRRLSLDGAELRHGYLEIREHLEQESLESLVAAVEFTDQQHRRLPRARARRRPPAPPGARAAGAGE